MLYPSFINIIPILILQQCHAFNIPSKSYNGLQTPLRLDWPLQASKRSGAMSRKKKQGNSNKNNSSNAGFGQSNPKKSSVKELPSGVIYSRPGLYDLAFGYRNYEEEVGFLLSVHDKYSIDENVGENGRNIIELAAGPARHCITSLRDHENLISSCTAIDISVEMKEYSNLLADEELGDAGYGGCRDRFTYINEDMRNIGNEAVENKDGDVEKKLKSNSYDSAWILLGSMQHLTTNDDVISCFKSVHNLLRPGGTMVIELPHPRQTFTMVECTRNGWQVPLEDETGAEYGELKITWGDDDDKFDPIRQVRDFTVALDLIIDDKSEDADFSDLQSVKEIVPMRLFTYQEIDALSRISGFEIVQLHGALCDEIDVNNEDEAFRLVCVLRKQI